MKGRVSNFWAVAGLGSVFVLGFIAAHLSFSTWAGIGHLLSNPFNIATHVTPSGPVVLEEIQRLNRLETCRYNGNVIVRGDTEGVLPTWLVGDRILFVGHGEVVAGIDLSHLTADDVRVQAGHVSLHLPSAEILHTRLDNRQSEVYERQTGIFSKPDMTLETKVRVEAEERIRQAAVDNGVLKNADEKARAAMRGQLQLLGFQDISFV